MKGLFRLDGWLITIPLWIYSLTLMVAIVIKGGISFAPLGTDELASFPLPPENWSSLSYGMRTIVFLTGQDGDLAFGVVGFVLVLSSIVLITFLASRSFEPTVARVFLALIIVGPIGMILMNRIGRNDVFMILGAVIFTLHGRRILLMLIGLVLMLLGNPEQTVVAMSILLLISMLPQLRQWRMKAFSGLVVALIVFAPLWLLARSVGVKSRIEFLQDYLSSSFYAFAANLPLSLYAAFGAVWLVIGWLFIKSSMRNRVWLLLALVVVPVVVTMITVDQTRVFVGVTTIAIAVLLKEFLPKLVEQLMDLNFKPILAASFIIVLFLPVIDIWGSSGHARTPYLWVFTSIVPQIKVLILG